MDFPIFQADFFGNRFLIGFIAIVHVIINHSFAVGMMPLLAFFEWWCYRNGRDEWDRLLYRILAVAFVVTTTVGALTGVGIWFSTSVVNPVAIGSLLRVFYWAWFSEWVVFVSEVVLILIYFLTWKRMTGDRKPAHIRIGIALGLMSWLTMAIITAILGFMMNTGDWTQQRSLLTGFLNPVYVPQLLFRTTVALALAGSLALALSIAFTRNDRALRAQAIRWFSGWTLFWSIPVAIASLLYYAVIPQEMMANMPVAFGTIAWASQYAILLKITLATAAAVILVSVWGVVRPGWGGAVTWIIPFACLALLLGQFERARQFVRKPYVLAYYMYSNGVRVNESAYLVKTGLLPNANWTSERGVGADNKIPAGRDIFMIACSRCHTINGLNSIKGNLARLYPGQVWQETVIDAYIKNIHGARAYMPPFPGTVEERGALAAYLVRLQSSHDVVVSPFDKRK